MWNCDSFKSSRPDVINLDFYKEFLDILIVELWHFDYDFHMNGKLTKVINSTFIALISKVDTP